MYHLRIVFSWQFFIIESFITLPLQWHPLVYHLLDLKYLITNTNVQHILLVLSVLYYNQQILHNASPEHNGINAFIQKQSFIHVSRFILKLVTSIIFNIIMSHGFLKF